MASPPLYKLHINSSRKSWDFGGDAGAKKLEELGLGRDED